MELVQLESPRSELYNSRYTINKSGISAGLTDSSSSKVSGITLWRCNQNFWILDRKTPMKILNSIGWCRARGREQATREASSPSRAPPDVLLVDRETTASENRGGGSRLGLWRHREARARVWAKDLKRGQHRFYRDSRRPRHAGPWPGACAGAMRHGPKLGPGLVRPEVGDDRWPPPVGDRGGGARDAAAHLSATAGEGRGTQLRWASVGPGAVLRYEAAGWCTSKQRSSGAKKKTSDWRATGRVGLQSKRVPSDLCVEFEDLCQT
jgi:hypothetical protein